MPVGISLTQGKEIHGEAVAFLLPSHFFFCSELGREPGSRCHVRGAPNRLALIWQTEEDAQHMLCLCYDTGTDVMGPMQALPAMLTPQIVHRALRH